MPRAGQVKPPVVERLSDRIAIGVLTSTYPPGLVDQVVAEAGRREERQRLLPARVVVWLVLAMALFSGQAYEEVARLLAGGLGWAHRWRQWWRVPSTPGPRQSRGMHQMSEYAYGWTLPSDLDQRRHIGLGS
jgi:hypothetical protein